MKIVYVAHPVSGDVSGNIEKIIGIVRDINLQEPEILPLSSYITDLYALDDSNPEERERGIKNATKLLRTGIFHEMRLYGDKISNGMLKEIELAEELNIPVIAMTPETKIALKYI